MEHQETEGRKAKKNKQNGEAAAPAPEANSAFPTSVTRRLRGHTFVVPFKPEWVPGYTLNFDDALFINSARTAMALSAYGDVLTKLKDPEREGGPLSEDEIQAHAAQYFQEYEWKPRGETIQLDPVTAEIRRLAWAEISHQANARGKTVAGVTREVKNDAVDKYVAKFENRLRQQAEANLANAKQFGDEDFLAEIGARDLKSASAPAQA